MSTLVMIAALGMLAPAFAMLVADDYQAATFMVALAVFMLCLGIYEAVTS